MTRIILLAILLFLSPLSKAEVYTVNILGYQYEDSSRISVEGIYQRVLSSAPVLSEKKMSDKGTPKVRRQENKTGVFFLSILLLFVFAGVRLMFSHQFAGSFAVLKNMNDKRKTQTETDNISLLSFYALYLLTLGYTSYYFLTYYKGLFTHLPSIAGVFICVASVTFLFIIKNVFMFVVAWAFDQKALLSQYFANVSMVYKITAIVLFPLSILMLISSNELSIILLKIAVCILTLAMLLRYFRNLSLIKKLLSVYFLHFFVYLCAFEIIPLMLLFKWMR